VGKKHHVQCAHNKHFICHDPIQHNPLPSSFIMQNVDVKNGCASLAEIHRFLVYVDMRNPEQAEFRERFRNSPFSKGGWFQDVTALALTPLPACMSVLPMVVDKREHRCYSGRQAVDFVTQWVPVAGLRAAGGDTHKLLTRGGATDALTVDDDDVHVRRFGL
jgi:hypothetical protein